MSEQLTRDGTCPVCNTPIQHNVSADDLLDRIKVLEGEVAKWEEHARLLRVQIEVGNSAFNHKFKECVEITLLLHRCLNTGLRDDKHRPLYLEVCRVLGVDPDKPWEEK